MPGAGGDAGRGRHRKRRLLLSKLYTYAACARRPSAVDDEGSRIGGPGFSRVVHANDPAAAATTAAEGGYRSNYISTTKYSAVTFIPKSLFEQFRRVANIYFLAVALLAFTPIAPFRWATAVGPLVLVLLATMVKEAIEDWRRKQLVPFLDLHLHLQPWKKTYFDVVISLPIKPVKPSQFS
jgi:phospholipid-translocating ATPase